MPTLVDGAPSSGLPTGSTRSARSQGPIHPIDPRRVAASRGSLQRMSKGLLAPHHRFICILTAYRPFVKSVFAFWGKNGITRPAVPGPNHYPDGSALERLPVGVGRGRPHPAFGHLPLKGKANTVHAGCLPLQGKVDFGKIACNFAERRMRFPPYGRTLRFPHPPKDPSLRDSLRRHIPAYSPSSRGKLSSKPQ